MWCFPFATVALLLVAGAYSEQYNSTTDAADTCSLHDGEGPWMAALQLWTLSASEQTGRQGRIMALPPSQGYYVTDRIDSPMLAPPPPPQLTPPHGKQPNHPNYPPGVRPYDEWQHSPPLPPTTGKIVNRPPNPYKDKFKPSYPAPVQNQPIPVHSPAVTTVDRADENRPLPQKQVSETDLYLLGAIEKLVYRADIMEKRLRKVEETMHYLVAGVDTKPEPCAENFTRVGGGCYHVSSDAVNWKGASYACRRLKANMLEIDSEHEMKSLMSAVIADKRTKGDGHLNTDYRQTCDQSCQYVNCVLVMKYFKAVVYSLTGIQLVYYIYKLITRLPSRIKRFEEMPKYYGTNSLDIAKIDSNSKSLLLNTAKYSKFY